MKKTLTGRFWTALCLFSLIGQVAWVVENMYFNVFIYKIFSASPGDISLMVAASAVSATLTTVLIGALSDRVGKRKLFMVGGYILWGLSILSFSLIRVDVIGTLFPAASAAAVGITLVIIMDCVMTFFGSSANDAAFNAWLTDHTDDSNRGAAEGINSMMPLVAILAVFGGFMAFDLDKTESWSLIFTIIGGVVILIGVLGIFLIKEPSIRPDKSSYFGTVLYGFSPRTVKENKSLYLALAAFIVFNISIQIFMPYLIIYYEVSLGMSDYVLVMAPAIVLASAVTAFWGRVYDKKGFKMSASVSLVWLLLGYALLFLTRAKLPVFIGSLLMMSGYLSGMAVFGAIIRDSTPDGKAGRLQGVRIFSQVLLPGLIGPFIGKLVLADAKTIVGGDGTESFIPSADIFLAAAVPALLLLLAVLLLVRPKRSRTAVLNTPYEVGTIPHDYHPNPMLRRDDYVNLNGAWSLRIENKNAEIWCGSITVPFPPESALSGVGHITKKGETLIYSRPLPIKAHTGRVLLHFGACDNDCEVLINEKSVGTHTGGYLSFTFDITDAVTEGENKLTVRVRDALDHTYPWGKQKHRRGGMWYTPVSGLWQTVWVEYVPTSYIQELKIDTTLTAVTFTVHGDEEQKAVVIDGVEYPFLGDMLTVKLPSPILWTPETPHIYDCLIKSGEDTVHTYFALREIGIDRSSGQPRLTLNGKPYFFHGLLDQGYYPDGIYTPASIEGFREDILRMKALGFNMLRKHIKIEPPVFYYLCDTLGMAVFQDMVNNGHYRFFYDTALPTVGLKRLPRRESARVREVFYESARETAAQLYNHPSVLYYTIFNEGWGQHNPKTAYETLKSLDPSRIWDTASGWFGKGNSDVQSEHVYFKKADFKFDPTRPVVLSEFGGYSCNLKGHSFNLDRVYGYRICKTPEGLTRDLERLYREEVLPLCKRGLSAAVLTQVSDVEDETNGLVTYDRRVVKVDDEVMLAVAEQLKEAFDERP